MTNPNTPIRDPDLILPIALPYKSPPLSLNKRMHWAQESRIRNSLREFVWATLRRSRIERPADHVVAQLHWRPGRRGRYDTDNPVPTLKPCVDALSPPVRAYRDKRGKIHPAVLGYGLIPDDVPRYVTRPEIALHEPDGLAALWLELRIWYPNPEGTPST